jgi:hypothetical protein
MDVQLIKLKVSSSLVQSTGIPCAINLPKTMNRSSRKHEFQITQSLKRQPYWYCHLQAEQKSIFDKNCYLSKLASSSKLSITGPSHMIQWWSMWYTWHLYTLLSYCICVSCMVLYRTPHQYRTEMHFIRRLARLRQSSMSPVMPLRWGALHQRVLFIAKKIIRSSRAREKNSLHKRHPEHQSRSYTYKRSWRGKKICRRSTIVMTSLFRSPESSNSCHLIIFKSNLVA